MNEVLLMLGSGLTTGVITVLTIKIDVRWMKEKLQEHHERLTHIERNI